MAFKKTKKHDSSACKNQPSAENIYSIACKENILANAFHSEEEKIKNVILQLKEKSAKEPTDSINSIIVENQKLEEILKEIISKETLLLSELLSSLGTSRD